MGDGGQSKLRLAKEAKEKRKEKGGFAEGVLGGGANRRGKRACQRRRKSRGRSRGRLSGKNILNLRHPHLLMSGIFSIDL